MTIPTIVHWTSKGRSPASEWSQPDVQGSRSCGSTNAQPRKMPMRNAEARTSVVRSALMVHCENYGDNQDRYEVATNANWHNLHHFFLRSEYGRVLVAFFDKTWQQPKNTKKPRQKTRPCHKRRQRDDVNSSLHSFTNCLIKITVVRQTGRPNNDLICGRARY